MDSNGRIPGHFQPPCSIFSAEKAVIPPSFATNLEEKVTDGATPLNTRIEGRVSTTTPPLGKRTLAAQMTGLHNCINDGYRADVSRLGRGMTLGKYGSRDLAGNWMVGRRKARRTWFLLAS